MTRKEFQEELDKYPEDMEVFVESRQSIKEANIDNTILRTWLDGIYLYSSLGLKNTFEAIIIR